MSSDSRPPCCRTLRGWRRSATPASRPRLARFCQPSPAPPKQPCSQAGCPGTTGSWAMAGTSATWPRCSSGGRVMPSWAARRTNSGTPEGVATVSSSPSPRCSGGSICMPLWTRLSRPGPSIRPTAGRSRASTPTHLHSRPISRDRSAGFHCLTSGDRGLASGHRSGSPRPPGS